MRFRRLLAAVPAVLIMAVPAAAAAATAAQSASYGAESVGASPQETEQGWFTLSASPGAVLERSIRLRNTSPNPINFGVSPVAASTMDTGGVSYDANDSRNVGVASWVRFAEPAVTVQPGTSAAVQFTVHVPAEVAAGDHLAGLAIWDANETPVEERAGEGFGATVSVRSRRVIALQVTVDGPATTALAINGVDAGARPDGAYLLLKLSNTGQRLTKASGIIRVASADFERPFDVDTFVPGTTIAYPVKWPDHELPRTADVEVELDVIGGDAVRFAGPVNFGDDIRTELADRVVTEGPTTHSPETGTSVGILDGGKRRSGAATAALAAFGALFYVIRRRARRSDPNDLSDVSMFAPVGTVAANQSAWTGRAATSYVPVRDPHIDQPQGTPNAQRREPKETPARWKPRRRKYTPRHSARPSKGSLLR